MRRLEAIAREELPMDRDLAVQILTDPELDVGTLLGVAGNLRRKYFSNLVQVHVLNNIKNGNCSEDCGYCAQRKSAKADEIPDYVTKPDEEILREAKEAALAGAYRYCLVTAGWGPGQNSVHRLSRIIRKIKDEYKLEVCLSSGILKDAESARELAEAGLDRYNHNLNTSEEHYGEICTTHTYQDRKDTLENLSSAGVSLCSGVIVGMGESPADLADAAFELKRLGARSIPVNFFIPVPGHGIENPGELDADYCLRILSMFRLINPDAEIRMAAGREMYLKDRQGEGLGVANSLFVSGYLNVKGSDARATLEMMLAAGFTPDLVQSEISVALRAFLEERGTQTAASDEQGALPANDAVAVGDSRPDMKSMEELRPFRENK